MGSLNTRKISTPIWLPCCPSPATYAFAAPAIGEMKWVPYVPMMLPKYAKALGVLTVHRYPYSACSTTQPTTTDMLAEKATHGVAEEYASVLALGRQYGIDVRFDELNSITCGGVASVSQSYVSSLWAADLLFELAGAGTGGINFHTPGGNAVFEFPKNGPFLVHGVYYGMLFFSLATAHGGRLLPVHIEDPAKTKLKAWATIGSTDRLESRCSIRIRRPPLTSPSPCRRVAERQPLCASKGPRSRPFRGFAWAERRSTGRRMAARSVSQRPRPSSPREQTTLSTCRH